MKERKAFLISQSFNVTYPNEKNVFMGPNHEEKEINTCIHFCHNWWNNIDSKKWWKEKLFRPSQSINIIFPNEENVYMVPNHEQKERLLCARMFVTIDEITLIPNNEGRKSFSYQAKYQCHLSQWGKCVYYGQSWKKGDSYVHRCLSWLTE